MATYGGLVEKSSNDGSSGNWSIPTGVSNIRGVAVGSGGSGHGDNDGDDEGGGGGGAGCAVGYKTVNASRNQIQWRAAGQPGISSGGPDGSDSKVVANDGTNYAYANGGEGGTDNNGGGPGGSGNGNESNESGRSGYDDDDGGRGGSAGNCPYDSKKNGGRGRSVSWSNGSVSLGCNSPVGPSNREGGPFGGGGAGKQGSTGPERGGRGYAGWAYFYPAPTINSLSGNTQTNSGIKFGETPSRDVKVTWNTSNTQKVEIKKSGTLYATSTKKSGSATFDIGVNSTAGSNSPRCRTFNFIAYGYGGQTVTQQVTCCVYNDNSVTTSSLTKTFSNLDPDDGVQDFTMGVPGGHDIPIFVWAPDDDDVFFKQSGGGGSAAQKKIQVGNGVIIRAKIPDYDVDITGRTSNTTGNIQTRTIRVRMGSNADFDVKLQANRPTISESFNFAGETGQYPYSGGQIHFGPSSDAKSLLYSNSIQVNDIAFSKAEIDARLASGEISTEIKVDDDNMQIKRDSDAWKTPRQI